MFKVNNILKRKVKALQKVKAFKVKVSSKFLTTKSLTNKCQCCPHIANQLTGFYIRPTLAFNGLSNVSRIIIIKLTIKIITTIIFFILG